MVVKELFINKHVDKNRYYGDSSCLTYLKKEIRNSIMPKNIKDIDMINCSSSNIKLYYVKKIMLIVIYLKKLY